MKKQYIGLILMGLMSSTSFAQSNSCQKKISENKTPVEQVWTLEEPIQLYGALSVGLVVSEENNDGENQLGCAFNYGSDRYDTLKAGLGLKVSIKYQPRVERHWCKAKRSERLSIDQLIASCRKFTEEYQSPEFLSQFKFKRIKKNIIATEYHQDGYDHYDLFYEGPHHVYVEIKGEKDVYGFSCWDSVKTYQDLIDILPVSGIKCP